MFGKAFFEDGHTEPILNYMWNPTQSELYFTTPSGQRGFKQYVESDIYKTASTFQPLTYKTHRFYKYDEERQRWMCECLGVEYVEIYTEVLPND